jgi:hypothetical protein
MALRIQEGGVIASIDSWSAGRLGDDRVLISAGRTSVGVRFRVGVGVRLSMVIGLCVMARLGVMVGRVGLGQESGRVRVRALDVRWVVEGK